MSKMKFVITSLKKQKLKFFMIFLVTLLTLLIFNISSSLKESVVETRMEQLRDLTENSQIIISASDGTYADFDEQIFSSLFPEEDCDYIEERIARVYCNVDVKKQDTSLFLYGTDVKKQVKIYDFALESGSTDDWSEHDIMVSSGFAADYNLTVGDTLEIQLDEKIEKMQIKAISKDEGMFKNAYSLGITSQDFLNEFAERDGLINRIDLTLSDLGQMDEITSKMNDKLYGSGVSAEAKYNMSYFQAYVTTVVLALNMFSIFLVMLSVYMLYSMFQSYVYENVGQMATLRSIGYSISEYRGLLCIQVLFVVLISFLCSIILTPMSIKILGGFIFQQDTKVILDYGMILVKGLIVGIIAVVSIYLASYKVSKTSIVSVIRNHISFQKTSFHRNRLIFAVLFFVLTIFVEFYNSSKNDLLFHYAVLIGIVITFLLMQELLVNIYATIIQKLFSKRKKSLGLFGKQVKTTLISYLPAITTIAFVLSVSMVIFSISDILNQAMDKIYNGADLYMNIYSSDYTSYLDILDSYEEIDSYIVEQRKTVKINEDNVLIASVAEDLTDEELKMVVDCEENQVLRELAVQKNTVIISDTLAKRWDKKKGDSINVDGISFEILDIVKTFENKGDILFISEESFVNTQKGYDYSIILIKKRDDTDSNELKASIQEELDELGDAWIQTIEEMTNNNKESNEVIIKAIQVLSFIIILVSGIGLCSVVMINILVRQKDFIVYQTLGVSKFHILQMSFFEAVAISIYGIVNALIVQRILLGVIVEILSYYVGSLPMSVNISSSVTLLFVMIILTAIIMIGVTKKCALSGKIIEKIKVS